MKRLYTFDTHGGDSTLNHRSGQQVEIVCKVDPSKYDGCETGPMYRVRFTSDGFEVDAFADEIRIGREGHLNLLNLSNYERMTPAECWERHGWGSEAIDGSTVLHLNIDGHELFVDVVDDGYGGEHACEIFDENRGLEGQWFADTPQDAIRGAVIDSIGMQVIRDECCCEDAVNVIAGTAYKMLFGPLELTDEAIEQLDMLLGMAREYVKSHIKWVDYEWEEF